jgi:hypothetical protein
VLDLYAEKFNALLQFSEEKRRRDMYKDPEFKKYRHQLSEKGPTGYPALMLRNAHKILMKKAVCNFVGIKKSGSSNSVEWKNRMVSRLYICIG